MAIGRSRSPSPPCSDDSDLEVVPPGILPQEAQRSVNLEARRATEARRRRTTNPGGDGARSPGNPPTPPTVPPVIEIEDTPDEVDTTSGDLHAVMETLSLADEPDDSRERTRVLARERHAVQKAHLGFASRESTPASPTQAPVAPPEGDRAFPRDLCTALEALQIANPTNTPPP
ncbi:hypothetical protein QBC46DRAFT_356114 [Diplogelasinospora grovesii]|uniref:Uncharacterized protein n=1 Tax=Diplogelasinospora grovesii TaxID=303347 RepID=A0AAN6S2J7_9PEZI|nr:hypothetical protein QBC46DRAFT_356114 [Diplogelasinospora grovesii]